MNEPDTDCKLPDSAAALICEEISRQQVIPFARFMELALYGPGSGFYERRRTVIGKRGDFFTSVSVGSLFGKLLACQFVSWIGDLGPGRCSLVEAGAGNGDLAADILGWIRDQPGRRTEMPEYWILEPSPRQQQLQRERLAEFEGKVHWAVRFEHLPAGGVEGVLFANELLDAMPVRRVGWDAAARRWFEWGVTHDAGGFRWQRIDAPVIPTALDPLNGLPDGLRDVLPDGFTTEIGAAAVEWWSRAGRVLKRGWLMTLDYGLDGHEFLLPGRVQGTLRSYRGHRLTADVLADPGEQDITAHVNFSAIRGAGEQAGLRTECLVSQGEFLGRVATRWLEGGSGPAWTPGEKRQFLTLVHPEHLGSRFRVLVQARP